MTRSPHHPSSGNHHLHAAMAEHGFAVLHVGYGVCSTPGCCAPPSLVPWSYTVGLARAGGHELVMLGQQLEFTHLVLDEFARASMCGTLPNEGVVERDGTRLTTVDVPDDWVLTDPDRVAQWFACRDTGWPALPRLRQVVWAGADGRFPDDPSGKAECAAVQPILRDDPFSLPLTAGRPRRRLGRHRRAA